jgi:hypothetical protein
VLSVVHPCISLQIQRVAPYMPPTIAIHARAGSFSERWVERCRELGVHHTVVDCYGSDIISKLRGVDGLLWHWTHDRPADLMMARSVLTAAERLGLQVFPNTETCWHFDDKVAQKYLLESVQAPLAPAHAFFDEDTARAWARAAVYPLVFKLRRGAGASNVQLVRTRGEALKLISRAFGRGFDPVPKYTHDFTRRVAGMRRRRESLSALLRRAPRVLSSLRRRSRLGGAERGYVYFQEFLPGNDCDTRVTVIGRRAFAFTRQTRPGDFRASGSGLLDHRRERIDLRCIAVAFTVARRLCVQSVAFDFAKAADGGPRILEMSYAYQASAVYECPGHWTDELTWIEGHTWPQDAILQDLLDRVRLHSGTKAVDTCAAR